MFRIPKLARRNKAKHVSKRLPHIVDRATNKQKRQYHQAMTKLKKLNNIELRRQRKEFEKTMHRLRLAYRRKILAANYKHRLAKQMWQKKFAAQIKADRKRFEQELTRLKKSYQLQLEHIRNIYDSQAALMHQELADTFDRQSKVNRDNFERIIAANQGQLEKLQKWLQDELVAQLIEKKRSTENSDIEQIKMAADLKIKKLRDALEDREAEIQQLQDRLHNAEAKKVAGYARLLSRKMRSALTTPHGEIINEEKIGSNNNNQES